MCPAVKVVALLSAASPVRTSSIVMPPTTMSYCGPAGRSEMLQAPTHRGRRQKDKFTPSMCPYRFQRRSSAAANLPRSQDEWCSSPARSARRSRTAAYSHPADSRAPTLRPRCRLQAPAAPPRSTPRDRSAGLPMITGARARPECALITARLVSPQIPPPPSE